MADTRTEVRDAEISATGKRYCTSCQQSKHLDGGVMLRYRWQCAACVKRRLERTGDKQTGSYKL